MYLSCSLNVYDGVCLNALSRPKSNRVSLLYINADLPNIQMFNTKSSLVTSMSYDDNI